MANRIRGRRMPVDATPVGDALQSLAALNYTYCVQVSEAVDFVRK
jgi:hypothetical protein